MLYRFKSNAGATVIMLSDAAADLFRLMGRELQPQGIFEYLDLPELLHAIESGVAADEAAFEQAVAQAKATSQASPRRTGVSLRQRAWPLRELMRSAQAQRESVVWGV